MEPKSVTKSKLKNRTNIIKWMFIFCLLLTLFFSVLRLVERTKVFLSDFVSVESIIVLGVILSVITLIMFASSLDYIFLAKQDARKEFIRIFQIPPEGVYNSVEDSVTATLWNLFRKETSDWVVLKNAQQTHKIFQSNETQEKLNIALVQFGETRAILREAVEIASDWGFHVPIAIELDLQSVDNDKI